MRLAATPALMLVVAHLAAEAANAATSVPARIDPTGRIDVTAQLQRFVDSVPDGGTVRFGEHATYRIDGTLQFRDRHGLTLDGNGARLVAGTRGEPNRAHVRLLDGGGWTIRRLVIRGANPDGGHWTGKRQWQHGFDLRGVDGARLEHVTVTDVFGDDVYVGLSTTSARWSRDIAVIDASGIRSGRMAISVTAGRRVTIEGGFWSQPGLSTFDIEPNGRPGGADKVLIERTRVGPGSRHFALDVSGRGPVANVVMRDNILTGRPLRVHVDQGPERPRDVVIEGNRSTVPYSGPSPAPIVFRNTDGVTVRGNTQPLRGGGVLALVAIEGSTRIALPERRSRRTPSSGEGWEPYAALGVITGLLVIAQRWSRSRRRSAPR